MRKPSHNRTSATTYYVFETDLRTGSEVLAYTTTDRKLAKHVADKGNRLSEHQTYDVRVAA